ncbi:hypothetical protein LBMAG55_17530 [Verrucomicrobiota bacterium]|nr:hypothetical protein LBMAG55_17530 [Verrucomicrobiota bacterium]
MTNILRPWTRVAVVAACLLASLGAQAAADIVFLAGGRSHGPGEHEFKAGSELLAKAINEQSGLGLKAVVVSGWPKDETILDGIKCLVIYADGTSVVGKGWAKVDELAKKGTGIVFMHYAVHPDAKDGEKYYRPWIGGAFETGWSVNPHWVADLKALPNHPVARGVNGLVQAYDEFYYNMRFPAERSKVLDLVTAVPTRENVKKYINLWNEHGVDGLGKVQTLMWGIERADGGRGVGFSGGHNHRNWAIDGFRTLALNAIVWAAKVEVPATGVKSTPVTEDELNANLDDKGKNAPRLKLPQPGEFAKIPAAAIQVEREAKFGPPAASAPAPAAPAAPKAATPAATPTAGKPAAQTKDITAKDKVRLTELTADLKGAKELYLLVSDLGDSNCDWVSWIEPTLLMADGTTKNLIDLKWKSATASHGAVLVGKNNSKGPLSVAGKVYTNGIGTHATSVIAYDLPAGVVGFRTQVAIDDGGLERGGKRSPAAVRFMVFTQKPDEAKAVAVEDGPMLVPPELFTVPEGFEVTVWATSPMLFNPTNIDFDEKGRMFVAEGVNYRGKGGRRKEGDRIVILEDTSGAGKADKATVFVQDTNLASPLGVAAIDGKVVVSQPPDLIVYTDVNRDGVFDPAVDKREVLLTGFNGRQHDHSLHSVTVGPDGKWNFNQGNTGADFIDKAGRHFYMGSPYMLGGIAGKRSDDGNVWIGGFSVRMNADGSDLRIVGHNYRNSYEQAINSLGDLYQSDNDDPPACRVSLIMEGGNAGFASLDGKRSWGADKRPGQSTPVAEWRQEDPTTMPAGDVYGGGSPTGVAFYENGALGEKWNGLLLACEAGKNVIFGYQPKPDGAGMKLERFDFITSNKEKEWAGSDFLGGRATGVLKTMFRPADVTVGPDGAIYFADWFDPGVGGHGTRDNRYSGTIYRVAPKGFKSVVPKIDLGVPEGQLLALRSPASNVRGAGFARLKAQGDKVADDVASLLGDANPYVAARAVWLLAQLGDKGVALARKELASADATRRLVAFRALRAAGRDVFALCQSAATDASPAIRREVALALRDFKTPAAVATLVTVAKGFDGLDRAYLAAIGLGAIDREAEVYAALAKEMGAAPAAWSPAFAALTWRLHPPQSVAGVRERLFSGKLSADESKVALTGLAFTKSAAAAATMVELALDKSFVHRELANWWLQSRKGNDWKEFDVEKVMKLRGLYDPAKAVVTAVDLLPEAADAKPLSAVEQIAALKGDAARGKVTAAVCLGCHRLGDQGVDYGPNLTTYAKQQSVETVVLGIARPSAEISHGFEGVRLTTTDGIVVHGIVLSDADPVMLKCLGGVVQTIPKAKVKSLTPLPRSLMLYPSQMGLTDQSVADLVAYLRSL